MIAQAFMSLAGLLLSSSAGAEVRTIAGSGPVPHRMSEAVKARPVAATTVNHVAIDIDAAPDAVWRTIVDLYLSMPKAREQGRITQLEDPAYPLGSYRIRMGRDGAIDERIVHITERDDLARRLSLTADFLSVPGGLRVYATYHAQERPGGTRFAIDCHTDANYEMPAAGAPALPDMLASVKAHSDAVLSGFLERTKAQLEVEDRASSQK